MSYRNSDASDFTAFRVWTFRVRDRFGDSGLSGLASLALEGPRAVIVDFLLSCRVMGRRVEETMLSWLVRCARARLQDEILERRRKVATRASAAASQPAPTVLGPS